MFSIAQIKLAHSKVRSGADFPAYINEIKALGVTQYEAYVSDGHIDCQGEVNHSAKQPAKYDALVVTDTCNHSQFKAVLVAQQQGETDFLTFIWTYAAV